MNPAITQGSHTEDSPVGCLRGQRHLCCPGRWPLRDTRPLATRRAGVRGNDPSGVWRVLPPADTSFRRPRWLAPTFLAACQGTPMGSGSHRIRHLARWRCEGQGLARHSFQLELFHQRVELSGIQGLRCLCWDGLDPLSESPSCR